MAEPVWTFTTQDVLSTAEMSTSATGDVPTCLIINGSLTTLGEGDDGGIVTTVTILEVIQPYAIKGASFLQLTNGDLADIGPSPGDKPIELQVVRRVTTTITKRDGCVIRHQVDEERPFRPEAVRYRQLPSGARSYDVTDGTAAQITYLDAGAVKDDQAPAFRERYERLRLVSRVVTVPEYTGPEGERERQTVRTGIFHNPPRALFLEDDPEAGTKFFNGTLQLAGGGGVTLEEARFFGGPTDPASTGLDQVPIGNPGNVTVWFQVDVDDVGSEGGYQLSSLKVRTAFDTTDAGTWIYDESGASRSEFETARGVLLAAELETNQAIPGSESTHLRVVEKEDRGELAEVTIETLLGYLPAAEACTRDLALRQSSAPFGAIVCAGEASRWSRTEVLTSPWVETIDEARDAGILELRDRGAVEISMAIPPNPALVCGDPVLVDIPERGWVMRPGWVESIAHEQAERGVGEGPGAITGGVVVKVPFF